MCMPPMRVERFYCIAANHTCERGEEKETGTMKTIIAALALAALMATSALAQPSYRSYDCSAPTQYDSSGAPVDQHC
jgi:hypothetical protein